MKILFICKYNRFRSVLAEALFKKLNKNPNFKTKSAGLIIQNPIDKNTKEIAKELEIKIKPKPQKLTNKILQWQNLIIIIADDVSASKLKNNKDCKKLKVWKIKDAENDKESRLVAKRIKNKIKKLLGEIK